MKYNKGEEYIVTSKQGNNIGTWTLKIIDIDNRGMADTLWTSHLLKTTNSFKDSIKDLEEMNKHDTITVTRVNTLPDNLFIV